MGHGWYVHQEARGGARVERRREGGGRRGRGGRTRGWPVRMPFLCAALRATTQCGLVLPTTYLPLRATTQCGLVFMVGQSDVAVERWPQGRASQILLARLVPRRPVASSTE